MSGFFYAPNFTKVTAMNKDFKHFLDGLSIFGVIASLANWLPAIAALASLVWTCIRIYETKTMQGWLARRKKND